MGSQIAHRREDELMALKGQFVIAPNLKHVAEKKKNGDKKDNTKKEDKKVKIKNKKNTANKCKQKENEKWQCISQGQ